MHLINLYIKVSMEISIYMLFQRYITPRTATPSEHPYTQPNVYQDFNAPSVAAPSQASYLYPYAHSKATGISTYDYPANRTNDYASVTASSQYQSLYEGHGHVYQGTVQNYTRPKHGGKTGSEMSYAVPTHTNINVPIYSAMSGLESNHNGPSQRPKAPESVATYATVNKFNSKGPNTLVQMREKKKETNSTWRHRFSGRFWPGAITEDKNYPQAAKAPSKRVSEWFSSDGTGLRKFMVFTPPWARHN